MELTDRHPLPFSDWCFVCGNGNPRGLQGRFYRDNSRVCLVVTPDRTFNGYEGVLHGGVTAGLLDETMGWAAALVVGRMCLTAEITVRYIGHVPVERPLKIVAEPASVSRRLCIVEGKLWEADSTADNDAKDGIAMLARATGKFVPLSWEETAAIDEKLIYEPGIPRLFESGGNLR